MCRTLLCAHVWQPVAASMHSQGQAAKELELYFVAFIKKERCSTFLFYLLLLILFEIFLFLKAALQGPCVENKLWEKKQRIE